MAELTHPYAQWHVPFDRLRLPTAEEQEHYGFECKPISWHRVPKGMLVWSKSKKQFMLFSGYMDYTAEEKEDMAQIDAPPELEFVLLKGINHELVIE